MALTNLTFIEGERRMPLMTLPLRTTIIQLENARVMYSPGSTMSEQQLRDAGDITDVIAPSLLHTTGIPKAFEVFPNARYWGPNGVREKRPNIQWSGIFGNDPWPFAGQLDLIPLEGMKMVNEHVFYHVASRSLLVADLFFNLQHAHGLRERIVLGLFGTYRKFAVSRFFMAFVRDRPAFELSIAAIAAKRIENIIPSHGDIVSTNAAAQLRESLRERGVQSRTDLGSCDESSDLTGLPSATARAQRRR